MAFYPFLLSYYCFTNRLVCLKLHKDNLNVGSDWCDCLKIKLLYLVFVLQISFPKLWRGKNKLCYYIYTNMIDALVNKVRSYQGEKGTEFDPQIVLFKLSGCSKCKELEAELMVDGWSYETFDCNQNEHSDIADEIEFTLKTDAYPIVFILYPEPKIIVNTSGVIDKNIIILNADISFYKQLTIHL